MTTLQTALGMIYPPRCLTCSELVDHEFGLCGPCWRDTQFVTGASCDACGVPLRGGDSEEISHCDECLTTARPWGRGRAALVYRDNGRRLVLALKHGDREDIVIPASRWMAKVARELVRSNMLVMPVPLHWMRMLKRRYNQSQLLATALAKELGLETSPDILVRKKRTPSLEGMSRDARFEALQNSIHIHQKRRHRIAGRPVMLVDDVMTSGATLAAAAEACRQAGANHVCVVTLARTMKDP